MKVVKQNKTKNNIEENNGKYHNNPLDERVSSFLLSKINDTSIKLIYCDNILVSFCFIFSVDIFANSLFTFVKVLLSAFVTPSYVFNQIF